MDNTIFENQIQPETQISRRLVEINDSILVKIIISDYKFLVNALMATSEEDFCECIYEFIDKLKIYNPSTIRLTTTHSGCANLLNCFVCIGLLGKHLIELIIDLKLLISSVSTSHQKIKIDFFELNRLILTNHHSQLYDVFEHENALKRLKQNIFIKMLTRESVLDIILYYNNVVSTKIGLEKIQDPNYSVLDEIIIITTIDACVMSILSPRSTHAHICQQCDKKIRFLEAEMKQEILRTTQCYIQEESKKQDIYINDLEGFCYSLTTYLTS